MIKEAINRILELAEPHVLSPDETELLYSDRKLYPVQKEMKASAIEMTTLTSLVEYIKYDIDRKICSYLVHVVSPTRVDLISCLDYDRERETLVTVRAEVPDFSFNTSIGHEQFMIGVQSKFVDGAAEVNDKALILKFAGTVTAGSVTEYGDDGVTQKATIKQGVSSKAEAIVPSPCRLQPYRTFVEIEQPTSDFIFRLGERNGEVTCALFEADGGAWKIDAKNRIYNYLLNALEDKENIIVIA